MPKIYCDSCGKEQTEVEFMNEQCNECDPFCDPDELIKIFGEPDYEI